MTDDPFVNADRMLAALDFAGLAADRDEQHRRDKEQLLRGFLEVLDGLYGLEARGPQQVPIRAVAHLIRQALGVLAVAGVEPMDAVGKPLDLSRHEVVAVRDEAGVEVDTVLEETVRGYLWDGKLLRRARVIVAHPPAA